MDDRGGADPGATADPYDLLDGALTYLARDLADVVAPVTLRAPDGGVLPLYSRPENAAPHLDLLAAQEGPVVEARTLAADDPRGKEELVRAALANGATRVAFDPDEALLPSTTLSIAFALGYLIGHKRNSACI